MCRLTILVMIKYLDVSGIDVVFGSKTQDAVNRSNKVMI